MGLLIKLILILIIENLFFYQLLKWKKRKKFKSKKRSEDYLADLKSRFGEVFIKIT
ncbi:MULTISPECIES: hypothetical protein [unclassified Candidatus Frackibacter]|uniref:hypothetical protein n=1 Tax=unclassified Candidatus Frackibacter TaxID=2648818 RepID=UPI00159FF2A6|nr:MULTISPECIES: hypothetical protein [unclassified Candidatus Frackibacter]